MHAIHALMLRLARAMAILGGLVLVALVLLVCISVIGRGLSGVLHGELAQGAVPGLAAWLLDIGVGPVTGDFELVEAGTAFAIFAFLPLCQITGGHASVDIFTRVLPHGVNRVLRAVIEAVFAAVLVLIAWRLSEGMASKLRYEETSFLLQFPVWWAYAAALSGAVVAAVVGVWMAAVRIAEAVTGHVIAPEGSDPDH